MKSGAFCLSTEDKRKNPMHMKIRTEKRGDVKIEHGNER